MARMVLATGHATPEEHLLFASEGRRLGLQRSAHAPWRHPTVPEAAKPRGIRRTDRVGSL